MYEPKKINSPFCDLAEQKNVSKLIDYLESCLQIKVIKCHLDTDAWEARKLDRFKTLEVTRIEVSKINFEIILLYETDIRLRTKTLLEESMITAGQTNRERYHYLTRLLIRAQNLMDFYFRKNPVYNRVSDFNIVEICGTEEFDSNFHLLHLNDSLVHQLEREFNIRRSIFTMIFELILEKALDYADIVEEKGSNYVWAKLEKDGKRPNNPEKEIHELGFALANSDKLLFYCGKDKNTFIKDFLNFFNLPPDNIPSYRSRLSERNERVAPFLDELIEVVKCKNRLC
jgi:hypothetical protein